MVALRQPSPSVQRESFGGSSQPPDRVLADHNSAVIGSASAAPARAASDAAHNNPQQIAGKQERMNLRFIDADAPEMLERAGRVSARSYGRFRAAACGVPIAIGISDSLAVPQM